MANNRSAKKRVRVIAKKQMRNKRIRSSNKTAIKKVIAAIEAGNKTQAAELHRLAVKSIDQAIAKGVIHKNTANRKKSKMAIRLNRPQQNPG